MEHKLNVASCVNKKRGEFIHSLENLAHTTDETKLSNKPKINKSSQFARINHTLIAVLN